MTLLAQILDHNERFVKDQAYKPLTTSKFPDRNVVILTCMDTRLIELLPQAMNIRNGDAKLIRNAGGVVTSPFDQAMHDILLAVYDLKAEEIVIVGHTDCGAHGAGGESFRDKALRRGISEPVLDTLKHAGIDAEGWMRGFDRTVRESVLTSVGIVRQHPLLPEGVPVHGLVMDSATGELELVSGGYQTGEGS